MWLLAFALGWFLGNERNQEQLYILHHVAKGGCLDEFEAAMNKCRFNNTAADNAEACIKATAALRKCFAENPDSFGAYFTHRLDKGLNQDTKPTRKKIEEDERREYRWWTGMRSR